MRHRRSKMIAFTFAPKALSIALQNSNRIHNGTLVLNSMPANRFAGMLSDFDIALAYSHFDALNYHPNPPFFHLKIAYRVG